MITYGGPETAPEQPSDESVKINESLVINEFIADIFPEAHLLPADPVKRATARLFAALVDSKFFDAFRTFFFVPGTPAETLLDAFEAVQARLPVEGTGKFVLREEWSLADAAGVPFFVRAIMFLEQDLGKYAPEEGKKALDALKSPRFARMMKYLAAAKERPSVQKTYDEVNTISSRIRIGCR